MNKAEFPGVKENSAEQSCLLLVSAIEPVTVEGVSYMTQMDPDLVSSSGGDVAFKKGKPRSSPQNPVLGQGRLSLGDDSHSEAV